MIPDLSKMEEVRCPDCKRPLVVMPNPDDPNRATLVGCRCGRQDSYQIPDCIIAGFEGGPMFLYTERAQAEQGTDTAVRNEPQSTGDWIHWLDHLWNMTEYQPEDDLHDESDDL
jgi:uncharacterized protein YbaR (Trm112 family)